MNELLLMLSFGAIVFLLWLIHRIETVYVMYMNLLNEEHDWLQGHVDLLVERNVKIENPEDLYKRYAALPKLRSMYLKFWITKEDLEKSVKPIKDYYLQEAA